jgi:hypothetical protein
VAKKDQNETRRRAMAKRKGKRGTRGTSGKFHSDFLMAKELSKGLKNSPISREERRRCEFASALMESASKCVIAENYILLIF